MTTPATAPAPKGILLKADTIAEPFLAEVKTSLASLTPTRAPPKIVGILATASMPSRSYAEFTRKQCAALGIAFELRELGSALGDGNGNLNGNGDGVGVEEAIIEANADDTVDGIMVYYPIFGKEQDHYLQQIVSPFKDVEGLNYKFHFNLYHNIRYLEPKSLLASSPSLAHTPAPLKDDVPPPGTVKSILPCTPLGVVKALERVGVYNALLPYGDRAYGRIITVINRSEVVGRPLAALLANDGARVFSVDIDSIQEYTKRPSGGGGGGGGGGIARQRRAYHPHHVVRPAPPEFDLARCLALSDVVVSAVPSATYKVPTTALKDGCVCVNVAADKNFEVDVREKASLYIPAVGKVTILMLLRNL
ncbi:NAD-binding protein [Multifurca ochricompacta]|uniref:NAD-binding protein n=1 Tax=Multifurca ochricompacta TaxID=376703 RepID=A0AAD4QK32_9AGAM|nr:NAD-binding protein [Multifurca ochricompacta]